MVALGTDMDDGNATGDHGIPIFVREMALDDHGLPRTPMAIS